MGPCMQTTSITNIILETRTTNLRDGELIDLTREKIGEIKTVHTTHGELEAEPAHFRSGTQRRIADEALRDMATIPEGTAIPLTTDRGNPAGYIRFGIAPAAAEEANNIREQFTPAALAAPSAFEALFEAGAKIFNGIITETQAERDEREAKERQEKDREREAGRIAILQELAEVQAIRASLNPEQVVTQAALAAEEAALSTAATLAEPQAVHVSTSHNTEILDDTRAKLEERYAQEGGNGTFKGLALEALTSIAPTAIARETLLFLQSNDAGLKIVAEVRNDIGAFEQYIDPNPLEGARFGADRAAYQLAA